MRAVWVSGALALGIAALPLAALASHGKVGLWDITVKMSMPNMPKIPPDQIAKMRAMGVHISDDNTVTTQHCMTAEEVAADRPPQMQHQKDCSMQNIKSGGGSFSAEMVCTGAEMQGSGHVTVAYDSDAHYSGQMTFAGTAHGHPASMTNSFEGKWISGDCSAMAPH